MAALPDPQEWLQSSNDALCISLVSPTDSGVEPVATFHPRFTYPIFGDEEKIFGYKDLKISLRFRANDMRPHVQLAYSSKLKPSPGVDEPTDVMAVLKEGHHLPLLAFAKDSDFENSSRHFGDGWTPPGTLHATLNDSEAQYEVWRGSLDDPAIEQLNLRVQILVPLFIEGGSYIGRDSESDSPDLDLSDADRWTVFVLYRTEPLSRDPSKKLYVFVGYATVYRFFYFQPPTPPASPASPAEDWELPKGDMDLAELPCRTRLSQFVILPPFQGKGNGHRLYKTIFKHYHKHPQTHEFTVENPSEAFDDLRDICDLAFLNTLPEFKALRLDTSVSIPESGTVPRLILGAETLDHVRRKAKIAPRQFARVLDMHLMSQLPPSVRLNLDLDAEAPVPTKADEHQRRLWYLLVKQRLYKHNRDVLAQIEPSERAVKLRETLGAVEMEYARLLAAYNRTMTHQRNTDSPAKALEHESNGKRKLGHADTDEEASKKARVEGA